jgi:twinkle protein
VWFVAHPVKPVREPGKLPIPTLYDIAGSANWANKTDIGFSVYRDDQARKVDVHIRKVRYKLVGKIGQAAFRYNRRYSELEESAAGTARGYRED